MGVFPASIAWRGATLPRFSENPVLPPQLTPPHCHPSYHLLSLSLISTSPLSGATVTEESVVVKETENRSVSASNLLSSFMEILTHWVAPWVESLGNVNEMDDTEV